MENAFDNFGLGSCVNVKPNLTPGNIKKGVKAIGTPNDMYMVDPRKVVIIDGFNPRIKDETYYKGIKELALGMKEHGFYRDKPLAGYVGVKDGEEVVYVTEGHRRHDAVLYWLDALEGPSDLRVPFVPKPRGTSELDLNYALIESNKSQDFRPYELAMLVKRLHVAYGQSEPTIAAKMGKSIAYVRNLLIVAGAPEPIALMVLNGELSVTEAAEALGKFKDSAVEVLQKAKANSVAEGKSKVSKRFIPGHRFQAAVKKESGSLFEAVRQVRADEGYVALSEGTRSAIDDLVTRMEELEAKLAAKEAEAAEASANDDTQGQADA